MAVLVTGGAGYIGAHVVRLLQQRGADVVVVDDLSAGSAERIDGAQLETLDLAVDHAADRLTEVMKDAAVDAVVHFAARKQVGESVARPAWYYAQNIAGTAHLLEAMDRAAVGRLVFSSSAATYGMPDTALIAEDVTPRPINPYGETKLVCEWLVRDAVHAHGLRAVSLRYFNVAGAGWPDLGDQGVFNLVPIALDRLTRGEQPQVFGDDYPTPDGTCIRDYVHVLDLADAHLAVMDYLDREQRPYDTFNIGTGRGASVQEVLREVARATGLDVSPEVVSRRAGDPPTLVADVSRIRDTLGWTADHDLSAIVGSAWEAWAGR